jgi:uncharacterized protein YerC
MKVPESLAIITDILWEISDKDDFRDTLGDLFTPSEVCEMADRIEILRYLKSGLTQRDIAEKM